MAAPAGQSQVSFKGRKFVWSNLHVLIIVLVPISSYWSYLVVCSVVLLGEGRVGKTCVCLRYCQGVFTDGQESTIQATYLDKRLNLGKRSVKLMIWDTAGQERFHALGPIYYR
jgi:hypothetical protein